MTGSTTRSDYDSIDALNWSTLKLMDVTPAYAKHQYDHPEEREDKPAWVAGRAVHCAIQEPDQFHDRYVVMPVFSGKGMKAAKQEFLDNTPDKIEIIKSEDYDMAWRCASAVHHNKDAMQYLKGARFEHVIQWETSGVKCKGRIDALKDRVIDLKTTRRNTLSEVERDAAMFDYHAQLAWYHDGAVRAGLIDGKKLPVGIFIHASQKSSFVDIAILDMDGFEETLQGVSGTLEYGRDKYRSLLKKYIGCKASNWWPGMAPNPVMWVLPEWKLKKDEEMG